MKNTFNNLITCENITSCLKNGEFNIKEYFQNTQFSDEKIDIFFCGNSKTLEEVKYYNLCYKNRKRNLFY